MSCGRNRPIMTLLLHDDVQLYITVITAARIYELQLETLLNRSQQTWLLQIASSFKISTTFNTKIVRIST